MTRDAIKIAMLDSLCMNRSVIFVILAYILSAFALGHVVQFDVSLRLYSGPWLVVCFATFLAILLPITVLQLYRHRPLRPIAFVQDLLTRDLRIMERAIIALPCIMLFPIFTSTFTAVKRAIPIMHPYRLDPLFAQIDGIIHGGHAWELIHPLVGYPVVTFFLNFAYNLWFLVGWIIFALVTVMANRPLREQYLLSFLGCWIVLGSLAAIGLSSVGPCYYALFYPADPYAPLMDYLRSVNETYPIWALSTQQMLWENHVSNNPAFGAGISAMPSLHVAIAMLNALLLAKISRAAGIAGAIYVMLILVGSVHLGWHYAIDGYVSILGVLLIWRVAGWWAARSAKPAAVVLAYDEDRVSA